MIGVELGSTGVTQSSGAGVLVEAPRTPSDLLTRVAEGAPYVWTNGDESGINASHNVYAATIADAIRARGLDTDGEAVAVAVPGWWSPRVLDRVRRSIAYQGVHALLVNDAEAAVCEFASGGEQLPETVVVVNLSATCSSAVVVTDCGGDPTARPSPALAHSEGGLQLDAAVLRYAVDALAEGGETFAANLQSTEAERAALIQCRETREALSTSSRESLQLSNGGMRVLLTRSELEELAGPWIDAVSDIVSSAVAHAARPVQAVVLTGGLAQMPLVSQRLSADLGLEVFVPDEPRLAAIRGAGRLAAIWNQRPVKPQRGGLRALMRRLVPARSGLDVVTTATRGPRSGQPSREHLVSR